MCGAIVGGGVGILGVGKSNDVRSRSDGTVVDIGWRPRDAYLNGGGGVVFERASDNAASVISVVVVANPGDRRAVVEAADGKDVVGDGNACDGARLERGARSAHLCPR